MNYNILSGVHFMSSSYNNNLMLLLEVWS